MRLKPNRYLSYRAGASLRSITQRLKANWSGEKPGKRGVERRLSMAFGTGSAAGDSEIPAFDLDQDGQGRCCSVLPCKGTRHAAHHTTPLFPSCLLLRHCCHSRPFPCSSQPDASRASAPSWTEAAEDGGRDALSTALIRCVYPIPRGPCPQWLSVRRGSVDGEGKGGHGFYYCHFSFALGSSTLGFLVQPDCPSYSSCTIFSFQPRRSRPFASSHRLTGKT